MPVRISQEVDEALAAGVPVVALESALITHGLPHPDNIEVALDAEGEVRRRDAIPATIAVLDGDVTVGLGPERLERLADGRDNPVKISVRDLGPAAARAATGGTTIASTAHIAARAGIHVLATGGLGGVHSTDGAAWDVSADLLALRDASIVVVCSGVKSILDLNATLEFLETASVSVAAYRSDTIPGFYIADTNVMAPWRLDEPIEVATAFRAGIEVGHTGAVVVMNSPDPDDALSADEHNHLLHAAMEEAGKRGVVGKDVTPFLLGEMTARSKGRTLRANKALVVRNAGLAAQFAGAIATAPKSM
jgi:pseudouridine-5'-phosphate glycosidase